MDSKKRVEAGYDQIAGHYLRSKVSSDPLILGVLEDFSRSLPSDAEVLDLGCGAGVPVTQWLSKRYSVTGVDVSRRQIELARQNVPDAALIQSDVTALEFPSDTFHGVVSFYAVIHVPREEQSLLVTHIYQWLKPGGVFLANWATEEWEGEETDWEGWGAPMWWSHYGTERNLKMMTDAGFSIASADVKTSHGETWLWVQAVKPSDQEPMAS